MRRVLTILTILLVFSTSAWAANYTITTTDQQDAAIQVLLKKLNAERAATKPPTDSWLLQQFVDYHVAQWLDGLVTRARTHTDEELKKAAEMAPDDIKLKITNLLTCGKDVC